MIPPETLPLEALAQCRFCSEVSKASGESPIGTASTADHWLVMELPQPWIDNLYQEDPKIAPVITLLKQLYKEEGVMVRPIMIAPDAEYSQPGKTRVIYYYRSQQQFAQFDKQEYLVPDTDFSHLTQTIVGHLLKPPQELEAALKPFEPYRQNTPHLRDILVCTHGNVDTACSRFGFPLYQKLRKEYASEQSAEYSAEYSTEQAIFTPLRVWRCSHFGGHQFAPTLIDLPGGHYWGHLEPAALDFLIYQRGNIQQIRSYYRGWVGLNPFEQIVEREIWLQEGWDWLLYRKSGRTVDQGVEQGMSQPTWAEVEIQFTSPDQRITGTYHGRVEAREPVTTAVKSAKLGETIELQVVPQYQVSRLVKRCAEG